MIFIKLGLGSVWTQVRFGSVPPSCAWAHLALRPFPSKRLDFIGDLLDTHATWDYFRTILLILLPRIVELGEFMEIIFHWNLE